jgi:hypothetical protein
MRLTVTEKLITASLVDGEMMKGKRIGIRVSQNLPLLQEELAVASTGFGCAGLNSHQTAPSKRRAGL